jgi:hypothetical protein
LREFEELAQQRGIELTAVVSRGRTPGSRSAAVKSTLEATSLHIDTPGDSFHQVIANLKMPSKLAISIYIVFFLYS